MNLPSLLAQFRQLQEAGSEVRAKAKRGLAFERLLSDLFRQQGILMTEPFRINGEQIDGAFEFKGWTYLVEAKWQDSKQSTDALYAFQGKPDRRIEGTRGLFISMSGYHDTSVVRFAEGRKPNTILWKGEHIQAVLEGKLTLPEMIDASIRYAAERSQLLIPLDKVLAERTDHLFAAALEASAAQVDSEISAAVGRKFIPKLYVERNVQQDLDRLVHPERELESLIAELAQTGIRPAETVLKPQHNAAGDPLALLGLLLESARSRHTGPSRIEGVLGLFLNTLPRNLMGRMHVITSRAGMGKTNLLCHLAKVYAKQQPTVFLTGRSGITEDTTIKTLIESKLARYLRDPFPRDNCFAQFVAAARTKGTTVLVIVDALNEHKDYDVINAAISHFLYEVAGLPVVILVSCRDVYWPFFDTSLWPATHWKLFDRRLDLFSTAESETAIAAYFDFYHVVASLAKEAKEKLSHPLILRFFCEAYGDPSSPAPIRLHEVPDIRLKILFDEYLKRKLDSICHTAPQRFRTPRAVQAFLFRLADRMRAARCRDVPRNDVQTVTAHSDLESPESVYVSILGEDILLEEEPDAKTGQIRVVFTYDEFMEYIIARSMLRGVTLGEQIAFEGMVTECQDGAAEFRSLVGVLEYLAVIVKEEWQVPIWNAIDIEKEQFGSAVCRAIGKLGSEYIGDPEIRSLEAITGSKVRELRFQGVQRLRFVALDEQCVMSSRKGAMKALIQVLKREDDVVIRAEAVACFEEGNAASISAEAIKLAAWWEERKATAHTMGVVLSEDDSLILQHYREMFSRAGFRRILLTHYAEETLRVVHDVSPALVVTDMTKGPGMSGEEMARVLKANSLTREIPILLVSAVGLMGRDDDSSRSLFCGVVDKGGSDNIFEKLPRMLEMAIAGKYPG